MKTEEQNKKQEDASKQIQREVPIGAGRDGDDLSKVQTTDTIGKDVNSTDDPTDDLWK